MNNIAERALYKYQTSGLYYISFKIIIYDHNDSGQYYKTMITIIIYDHS